MAPTGYKPKDKSICKDQSACPPEETYLRAMQSWPGYINRSVSCQGATIELLKSPRFLREHPPPPGNPWSA